MDDKPVLETVFNPGNEVECEYTNYPGQLKTFHAAVDKLEEERLFLYLKEQNITNPLKLGTELTLIYENDQEEQSKLLRFISYVIEHNSDNLPLLTVAKPIPLEISSGRKSFRCEVKLPFLYYAERNKYPGEVVNLSETGLYVISTLPNPNLKEGTTLTFQITLPTVDKPLLLVGEITRINELKNTRQGIAINLLNATDSLQKEIIRYLYKRERELITQRQVITVETKPHKKAEINDPVRITSINDLVVEPRGTAPVKTLKLSDRTLDQQFTPKPSFNTVEQKQVTRQPSIYAGFWKRFWANTIDITIFFTGALIITLIFELLIVLIIDQIKIGLPNKEETIKNFLIGFGLVMGLAINWFYFARFESSSHQATMGKMAMKIIVVDLDQKPISFATANQRYWSKILSILTLMIGFLMAGFTTKKQALHDLVARTLVINKK